MADKKLLQRNYTKLADNMRAKEVSDIMRQRDRITEEMYDTILSHEDRADMAKDVLDIVREGPTGMVKELRKALCSVNQVGLAVLLGEMVDVDDYIKIKSSPVGLTIEKEALQDDIDIICSELDEAKVALSELAQVLDPTQEDICDTTIDLYKKSIGRSMKSLYREKASTEEALQQQEEELRRLDEEFIENAATLDKEVEAKEHLRLLVGRLERDHKKEVERLKDEMKQRTEDNSSRLGRIEVEKKNSDSMKRKLEKARVEAKSKNGALIQKVRRIRDKHYCTKCRKTVDAIFNSENLSKTVCRYHIAGIKRSGDGIDTPKEIAAGLYLCCGKNQASMCTEKSMHTCELHTPCRDLLSAYMKQQN